MVLVWGCYRGGVPRVAQTRGNEVSETKQHTETAEVLAAMLAENTGTSILDSGGAYGRHWQRNAGKTAADWLGEPAATVDRYGVTLSVFHYLLARLEHSPELESRWAEHVEANPDEGWVYLMESFAGQHWASEVWNTYNDSDFLTQTIQGVTFYDGGETYALVQIHNGCDVRGGYTRPRAFRVTDKNDGYFPSGYHDYSLTCDADETHSVSYVICEWVDWDGRTVDDESIPTFTDDGVTCAKCGSGMTLNV